MTITDNIGGRRWLLVCMCVLLACPLLWWGRLTGAEWVSLVQWLCGLYIAGNVGQRGIEAARDAKPPADPSGQTDP